MKNDAINIRDPFILKYNEKYYMYGTRGPTCWGKADGFDVYVGTDLQNWEGPFEVFHTFDGFWADRHYWAPEVHFYNGSFYMFASFKSETACRGTQILKADSPLGPFLPHSDGPVTPSDWECLDGTLYLSPDKTPYIVFCHEWLQIHDGTICAMELDKDLTHAVGAPRILLHATDAPWVRAAEGEGNYVTDGPFLYRTKDGTLLLLWSSFGVEGYTEALAVSDNGDISGNWTQVPELLFQKDGGHGMIFTGFDGKLYLTLHSPNETRKERPHFYELEEANGRLTVK